MISIVSNKEPIKSMASQQNKHWIWHSHSMRPTNYSPIHEQTQRYLTPDIQGSIPTILKTLQTVGPYTACSSDIQSKSLRTHKRIFNSKEVGDHHAIIPTTKSPLNGRLKPEEKKIYDLVARRFLAAFSEDALFDLSQIIVDIQPNDGEELPTGITAPLQFRSKGKVCVSPGWQVIDPPSKHTDSLLPDLTKGDATITLTSKTVEGKTRPPSHFTEASLLGSMEKAGRDLEDDELKRAMKGAGLGTPATRASIIENLIRRKYIERKKKNLHATTRGVSLIDSVPVEELKSALLTGKWESRLSNIAEGTDTRQAFMADVQSNLQSIVEQIKIPIPLSQKSSSILIKSRSVTALYVVHLFENSVPYLNVTADGAVHSLSMEKFRPEPFHKL